MTDHVRFQTAEFSPDEIVDATQSALDYARAEFGEQIDARTIDLRLWAAAALVNSAISVSFKRTIMRSFEQKLEIMRNPSTGIGENEHG